MVGNHNRNVFENPVMCAGFFVGQKKSSEKIWSCELCSYLRDIKQTKTHTVKIQANNPQALASKLETAGAIHKGSAANCAHHMTFANANVNGGRVWFGLATISQTANGWVAVINQNF